MNKRLALLLILVWGFLFTCFTLPVQVYADETKPKCKILPVPLVGQQTNSWCWAACGEMIMTYLGNKVTQYKQVEDKLKRTDIDCSECFKKSKKEKAPAYCYETGTPGFRKYGFDFSPTTFGKSLKWEELVAQIDSNKPVGFSWVWQKRKGSRAHVGHYMVARGYIILNDMKLVVVNDPLPANPDKSRGGSLKILTYHDYVEFGPRYKHWKDHYNITKKEKIQAAGQDGQGKLTGLIKNQDVPLPEKGGPDPVMITDDFNARQKAAHQSLQLFKKLLEQLPQPVLEQLGIKSQGMINEINNPSLGKALDIYLVGLSLLKVFQANVDPVKMLRNVDEVFYPVHVDGKPVSSITIRKRDGQWGFALIEDKRGFFKAMTKLKQDSPHAYFLVEVQALYLTFLAYSSGQGELYLIPTHEHPDLEFTLYEPVPAREVFLKLKYYLLDELVEEIVGTDRLEKLKDVWNIMSDAYKDLKNGKKK